MQSRRDKIKAKVKEFGPWIIIAGGTAITLFVSYKTVESARTHQADLTADQIRLNEIAANRALTQGEVLDRPGILVLEEVPAHEAGGSNDVYADLDNPGMYFEVKPL